MHLRQLGTALAQCAQPGGKAGADHAAPEYPILVHHIKGGGGCQGLPTTGSGVCRRVGGIHQPVLAPRRGDAPRTAWCGRGRWSARPARRPAPTCAPRTARCRCRLRIQIWRRDGPPKSKRPYGPSTVSESPGCARMRAKRGQFLRPAALCPRIRRFVPSAIRQPPPPAVESLIVRPGHV